MFLFCCFQVVCLLFGWLFLWFEGVQVCVERITVTWRARKWKEGRKTTKIVSNINRKQRKGFNMIFDCCAIDVNCGFDCYILSLVAVMYYEFECGFALLQTNKKHSNRQTDGWFECDDVIYKSLWLCVVCDCVRWANIEHMQKYTK